ncbi:caspase family protein [Limnobacter parvus]|uniref:Caspase family protein n=1 Tax=Limnobacter parvus TaxID=2939690 RepID=A0ABT1XGZ6_9BURK|nr:caspase family protein [Limnobacter parvus]MCR2745369.1 caspase family protein [Limnobacter parvus]
MAKSSFTTINNTLQCPGRRSALRASLDVFVGLVGLPFMALKFSGAQANSSATSNSPPSAQRLALIIGNGDYPVPHDLPPIQKNVTDMAEVLALRGFDVSQAMNLDEASLQTTVSEFVKRVAAAPRDAVTLFYYAGHGLQVDSNNLLLGSGSNPTAPRKDLLARSLVLQQKLLAALPSRPEALNITVIDACRTDLRNAFGDGEGLNQVEAPLGSMVCFSTGAGRPAVSPDNPNQNTFYTASLVKLLRESADHITFNDLFRMVKADVEQTMLNHPLNAIRQLAQYPFIADNAKVQVPLTWRGVVSGDEQAVKMSPEEKADLQLIQSTEWPVDLLKRCKEFLEKYPNSPQASSVALYQTGAADALRILRNKDVKLFKTSFVMPVATEQSIDSTSELNRAARGDKDAAARIARLHRQLETEQAMLRYVGWLQYASGLGNGIASYELALYYRESAQPLLAAQAEARARQLGYSPPRALGHERK